MQEVSRHLSTDPKVADEIRILIDESSGELCSGDGELLFELARMHVDDLDQVLDWRLALRANFEHRIDDLTKQLRALGILTSDIREIWVESNPVDRSVNVYVVAAQPDRVEALEALFRGDRILATMSGNNESIRRCQLTVGSPLSGGFHVGLLNWTGPRTQQVYRSINQ